VAVKNSIPSAPVLSDNPVSSKFDGAATPGLLS
jgi:hypothetical protein